ncbi:hypothetical protein RXV86_17345 [Alisedimentitalea sp. MJ-SS2]|uniref:hypothetical protein n=1 Tax=Aliisedimentitalea sp. MJ-SS2 TaxID=3049795 RepID=UPI002907A902|nr:hypothetical protein [Alisedimentitalea sp. MJ-SS2]MDU8929162.1 hypothetical protein [Alisedimentitalea sp. MJ-SS2]
MRAIPIGLFALSLVLLPAQSIAGNGNGKGKGKNNKRPPASVQAASPGTAACPPGLAKKSPACVPPGLAKNKRYRVGDRITADYDLLHNPARYRLDPDHSYYRVGDYLYRVDRDTGEVLHFIRAFAALLD